MPIPTVSTKSRSRPTTATGGTDTKTILVTLTDVNDASGHHHDQLATRPRTRRLGTVLANQDSDVTDRTPSHGGADQTDFGGRTDSTRPTYMPIRRCRPVTPTTATAVHVKTILVTLTDVNDAPAMTTFNSQACFWRPCRPNHHRGADQTDFTPRLTFRRRCGYRWRLRSAGHGQRRQRRYRRTQTILVTDADRSSQRMHRWITTTTFNAAENQTAVGNVLAERSSTATRVDLHDQRRCGSD